MSMTLRQFVYRYIYLRTPGWQATRWLWLGDDCQRCGRHGGALHLHHENYPFFGMWYSLFWIALVFWVFDERGLWVILALAIVPDVISRFRTLCAGCHEIVEKAKKNLRKPRRVR